MMKLNIQGGTLADFVAVKKKKKIKIIIKKLTQKTVLFTLLLETI